MKDSNAEHGWCLPGPPGQCKGQDREVGPLKATRALAEAQPLEGLPERLQGPRQCSFLMLASKADNIFHAYNKLADIRILYHMQTYITHRPSPS